MIGPSGAVRVMLATRPIDFRKGMDGLALVVSESLGADPFSGTVYAFRSKRADRLKLLFFDGTGVVLVAKRLEAGGFRWPKPGDTVIQLTAAEMAAGRKRTHWMWFVFPRAATHRGAGGRGLTTGGTSRCLAGRQPARDVL